MNQLTTYLKEEKQAKRKGDSETTLPEKVEIEMSKLNDWYNAGVRHCGLDPQPKRSEARRSQSPDYSNTMFENIVEYHYRFEKIHPFQDGNGRVGRLIMFRECLRNSVVPFIIDNGHKQFYYRGLREFENIKGYLLDTCLSAQDTYKEWVNYFYGERLGI